MAGPDRIIPSPPPGWDTWESLMELAYKEAKRAYALGEVPVGAVVVDGNGTILGTGHNEVELMHDPSAHAEIVAIRRAGLTAGNYRLEGAYLVVTMEPCLMCSGALVHARLAGVVYGAYDDKAGAVSSCMESLDAYFHNHRLWHMGGICEDTCSDLLVRFFSSRR